MTEEQEQPPVVEEGWYYNTVRHKMFYIYPHNADRVKYQVVSGMGRRNYQQIPMERFLKNYVRREDYDPTAEGASGGVDRPGSVGDGGLRVARRLSGQGAATYRPAAEARVADNLDIRLD